MQRVLDQDLCLFTWITFWCFRDLGGILGAPTTSDWMASRWGLMLKPSKCQFVCLQVEYLGNLITPSVSVASRNRSLRAQFRTAFYRALAIVGRAGRSPRAILCAYAVRPPTCAIAHGVINAQNDCKAIFLRDDTQCA